MIRTVASSKVVWGHMKRARRSLSLWLLAVLVAASVGVLATKPAHAATFTVNSTGDAGDQSLTDGRCFTGVFIQVGPTFVRECTLRAAIEETNANDNDATVVDLIHFSIPGSGVQTISPGSALPAMAEAVTINGYTQPGASRNTLAQGTNAELKIELRGPGPNTGLINGLDVNAPNVAVTGLVINNFSRNGINISSNGVGAVIEGNFIGTDPLADFQHLIHFNGVNIGADDVTIGGTTRGARNLISGNDSNGVNTSGTTGVEVLGNLIGTDKSGTSRLANGGDGVRVSGDGNTVGDVDPSDGLTNAANTIAFNEDDGVSIDDSDNRVVRNFIFSNGGDGVVVPINDDIRNRILSNSIYSNGEQGIDLGNDGITPNDAGDADLGANNLQNFPVLTSAVTSSGITTIQGRLNSTPNTTFAVQFFSNPAGTDEGKQFIGARSVTTNANGNTGIFTFTPNQPVGVGQRITATATSAGSTSEFSAAREVTRGVIGRTGS
jgi:CSLREA domain-containing protein